jgi:hypothetical protein
LAVSRNVYVPAVLNVALAFSEFALTKTTVPGPLTLLQLTVSELPLGSPSSVAFPVRVVPAGKTMDMSLPALTDGAWFVSAGLTKTTMSSDVDNKLSLTVRRKVYDPLMANDAVVFNDEALPNVTVPGPLILLHVLVKVLPDGRPSSDAVPASVAAAGNVII